MDGQRALCAHSQRRHPVAANIFFSALFSASLAFLAFPANAQQYGDNWVNLAFDATCVRGPYPCSSYDCDPMEFSRDYSVADISDSSCYGLGSNVPSPRCVAAAAAEGNPSCEQESPTSLSDNAGGDSKIQPSAAVLRPTMRPDFNQEIYFRNKLEFAVDGGWLPINVPFPFDFAVGDPYNLYPLRYTLMPIIASLRWHLDGIEGPWITRGNFDFTLGLSGTAIPRGPEKYYFSYDIAMRRNFVPRNWRATPYFEVRVGAGLCDAKGPEKVPWAQGEDFTFTANMGSGVRYNFSPRYAISAGLNYMHISNAGLSEPKVPNFGINVYGPMFGLDIQLHRHPRLSE